ncbi:TrbM/KikA/MpfK family conjugal transfer protein [Zooshikella sp. RANM57]|uniref:TrbM/KikA/MpfK family conjugal transfer protein n=1 Tax=Zooshikella sp. RANM57 TaxID=3425863 RepID=UPI003D6F52B6
MKPLITYGFCVWLVVGVSTSHALSDEAVLACGAVLCLASPAAPPQCNPYLAAFYAITDKKWAEQIQKRTDFLKLCPNPTIQSVASIYAVGIRDYCDATGLNHRNRRNRDGDPYILANMPADCEQFYNYSWNQLHKRPVYRNNRWYD